MNDEHRQHAIYKGQRFFQDQKVKMELERVEMVQKEVKEWITRNAPSMIAEKQRQFQEVMAPIAKSDKEKRENAKLQKKPKIYRRLWCRLQRVREYSQTD